MLTHSVSPSVNSSAVDVDTYFDTLDFDVYDLDITTSWIKNNASERRFQLPEPIYEPAYPEIKQPLSEVDLEQATYEVRLLARQLENSPFNMADSLAGSLEESDCDSLPQRLKYWSAIRRLSVGVGLLVISLSAYAYYTPCSTAMSCFGTAKRQLVGLVSDRPHPVKASSTASSRANPKTQAIAPASTPVTPDPFREAVNQAMQAAELTQTAHSSTDWETVVNTWLEAIRLMNITPSTNPRYRTAALKVEEYANNLAYAQRRMREAVKAAETQDTRSFQ
jgi:hypothetical protein